MKNENDLPRYCRKCLLSEMDEGKYFRRLHTYIRNLDPQLKVSEELYKARLDRCRGCDDLISGMCRICGCYVELRAVMKKNGCPAARPKWDAAPDEPDFTGHFPPSAS